MTEADVPSARELLNSYLSKFHLAPVLDDHDFKHWLIPRKGVVDTFVVVDKDGRVTDMCRYVCMCMLVCCNRDRELEGNRKRGSAEAEICSYPYNHAYKT